MAKKRKRGKNPGAKGGQFERAFCKRLSLWWTGQKRDDIFWRTASSGGRATVRIRQSRSTAGGYGDICALHPSGEPLLDVGVFELKRGYNKHSVHDLLDRPSTVMPEWEKFIGQAIESARQAGSFGWFAVTHRIRCEPMIWFPSRLMKVFEAGLGDRWRPTPFVSFHCLCRYNRREQPVHVCGTRLDEFFATVQPSLFDKVTDLL